MFAVPFFHQGGKHGSLNALGNVGVAVHDGGPRSEGFGPFLFAAAGVVDNHFFVFRRV
jgi:hypothetical protein